MKCPSCGAEVQENTRCEYCGSFIGQSAYEDTYDRTQDFINKRLAAANKRIIKMILFAAILLTFVSSIGLLVSFRFPIGSAPVPPVSDSTSDHSINSSAGVKSATDIYGNVASFGYDGSITVTCDGSSFRTKLTDVKLLQWLKDTNRSIEGVNILFSTDASGQIHEIALSSAVFFVLEKREDRYTILRDADFLSVSSDVSLSPGSFYSGYFHYPDVNVHTAVPEDVFTTALFNPVCDEKRETAVSDYYTGESLTCYQIRIGSGWYYCAKDFYDNCSENVVIQGDVCLNDSLRVIYAGE
ncbi:MAG: zinc ribbon domain-containing protein [Lachnospiraceae bacterium]|nr:zinc ribbon domain-containing protein [Lachnospiraceae bacterium]